MNELESQRYARRQRAPFQFGLRTLLLLFVVLASSLAVFGEVAIVIFPVVVGLALVTNRLSSSFSSPIVPVAGAMCCVVGVFALWSLPPISAARPSARRGNCLARLHELALALQSYHKANGRYPPAYIADKNGRPLHSWRTLLLPYLGYGDVYKRIDLTEPWNSPTNKEILAFHPREFFCSSDPSSQTSQSRQANYLAVVGANAAWAGEKPRKLSDFGSAPCRTIMLIEVAESHIDWPEPKDFPLDALAVAGNDSCALRVFSNHGHEDGFLFTVDRHSGVSAMTADGSVEYLPTEALSSDNLRRFLQIGGFSPKEIEPLFDRYYDVTYHAKWRNIAALAVWLLSVCALLSAAVQQEKQSFHRERSNLSGA